MKWLVLFALAACGGSKPPPPPPPKAEPPPPDREASPDRGQRSRRQQRDRREREGSHGQGGGRSRPVATPRRAVGLLHEEREAPALARRSRPDPLGHQEGRHRHGGQADGGERPRRVADREVSARGRALGVVRQADRRRRRLLVAARFLGEGRVVAVERGPSAARGRRPARQARGVRQEARAAATSVTITLYVGTHGRAQSVGFSSDSTEIDDKWAECATKAAMGWRLPDPKGIVAKLAVRKT